MIETFRYTFMSYPLNYHADGTKFDESTSNTNFESFDFYWRGGNKYCIRLIGFWLFA